MATGSRNANSGDVVLEGRHLIGLFVMMVVIFGVVFVLGYELGRNQMGQQVNAASKAPDMVAATQPAPKPTESPKRGTPSGTSSSAAKERSWPARPPSNRPRLPIGISTRPGTSQPPDRASGKAREDRARASSQAGRFFPERTGAIKRGARQQTRPASKVSRSRSRR